MKDQSSYAVGLMSRLIAGVQTAPIRQPRVRIPTPSGHTVEKLQREGKGGRNRMSEN